MMFYKHSKCQISFLIDEITRGTFIQTVPKKKIGPGVTKKSVEPKIQNRTGAELKPNQQPNGVFNTITCVL